LTFIKLSCSSFNYYKKNTRKGFVIMKKSLLATRFRPVLIIG
jgi:hypothetical protein